MLRIERHEDATAFFDRVRPFLAAREAENNLLLGFESSLAANPHTFGGEDPYLAAAVDDASGAVTGVAVRTPPFPLVLSQMDDAAAETFAAALAGADLPGLNAPTGVGAAFLARAQRGAEVAVAERVYEATSVAPPRVGGCLRHATASDRELLVGWFAAFFAEAMAGSVESDAVAAVDRKLAEPEGGFAVWEDGGSPVSFAGYGSPTPNGMRIGPVYTPPGFRGRGYGSAVTAGVTRYVLGHGRRFCFLYTDLSNPTSNSIYQRIGYRPVIDVNVWRFAGRAAP